LEVDADRLEDAAHRFRAIFADRVVQVVSELDSLQAQLLVLDGVLVLAVLGHDSICIDPNGGHKDGLVIFSNDLAQHVLLVVVRLLFGFIESLQQPLLGPLQRLKRFLRGPIVLFDAAD
jgi:hypothetical protein